MEEVKAEALRSNFAFTHPTVIHRIDRSQDTLKVYVSAGLSDFGCLVTFENPIGFRVVDERDLMEYWPVCSTPSGWLFHILGGGWLDQERKRHGSLMLEAYPDVKEYLIAGTNDCVSIFGFGEPTLSNWQVSSGYAWKISDIKILLEDFIDSPDNEELLLAAMQIVCERRDLFPTVDPRESILQLAKRYVGAV